MVVMQYRLSTSVLFTFVLQAIFSIVMIILILERQSLPCSPCFFGSSPVKAFRNLMSSCWAKIKLYPVVSTMPFKALQFEMVLWFVFFYYDEMHPSVRCLINCYVLFT